MRHNWRNYNNDGAGNLSIAIGTNTAATEEATAVGNNSTADEKSAAFGYSSDARGNPCGSPGCRVSLMGATQLLPAGGVMAGYYNLMRIR